MAILCRKKCNHKVQDRLYGKFYRVHNKTINGYRCTVCGNEFKKETNTKNKK